MSILGAVIGGVGSLLSSRSQSKSAGRAAEAAQFNPYNVYGPSGHVNIQRGANGAGGTINLQPMQDVRDMRTSFMQGAQSGLDRIDPASAEAAAALGSDLSGMGAGMIPGLGAAAIGQGENLSGYQPQFAANMRDISGLFGGAGMAGLGEAFGSPTAGGVTETALGAAGNMLSAPEARSFNDVAAERLATLRGAARPQEERAVNSAMQGLFSSGRLGTTGGARAMGEVAQQQELADLGRVVNSQDFAQNLTQQDFANQLQQMQLGQGLLNTGLQGVQTDINRGQNLGSLGSGMLRMTPDIERALFASVGSADESRISRGNQRLQTATGLFDFGQRQTDSAMDRAIQQLGGAQSIDDALLRQAGIGLEGGAAAAGAGARQGALMMQGASSPLGGALAGLGTGISNAGGVSGIVDSAQNMWKGLFN